MEKRVSALFRDIFRVLYGADDLCGSCLWGEYAAAGRPNEESGEKSASFWKGVVLQFVNVNIYLFGITALTGYVTNYSTSLPVLIFFGLVIATFGTVATSVWIGAGLVIQKIYLRHYRLINIALAVTLLECVYSISQSYRFSL